MTAIAIADWSVRRVVASTGWISERGEEREPDDDDARAEDLTRPDVLSGQEVAEGEREHDGRDEERLDESPDVPGRARRRCARYPTKSATVPK